MYDNPAEDWQGLTEVYRRMGDGELEQVAEAYGDLTQTAQEVLRSEMKSRGLGDPRAVRIAGEEADADATWRRASRFDLDGGDSGAEEDGDGDGRPGEFTWKTPLCECEDRDHAWQLSEALRRAGIESWIEQPGRGWVIGGPRVVVVADQLEQARAVAAQPIPQEIVDLSKMEVPEFVPPKCPSCGAEDPVLESAEPANSWLCEACGREWSEPVAEGDGEAEQAGR